MIKTVIILFLLFTSPIWIKFYVEISRFNRSVYRKETHHSYFAVVKDKGMTGEYYLAKVLDQIKGYHKMLVNCYLPTKRGTTTEMDVIFLHPTGIYVLESKNYSGWIFGNEKDLKWCQTFRNGHKEFFYNPIKQNETHIRHLQTQLSEIPPHVFHSIIVFSQRCELKKVSHTSENVQICKRNQLKSLLKEKLLHGQEVFSKEQIDRIYQQLKPYTNVSKEIKAQHIENIQKGGKRA